MVQKSGVILLEEVLCQAGIVDRGIVLLKPSALGCEPSAVREACCNISAQAAGVWWNLHILKLHCCIDGGDDEGRWWWPSTVPCREHLRWHHSNVPVMFEAIRTIKMTFFKNLSLKSPNWKFCGNRSCGLWRWLLFLKTLHLQMPPSGYWAAVSTSNGLDFGPTMVPFLDRQPFRFSVSAPLKCFDHFTFFFHSPSGSLKKFKMTGFQPSQPSSPPTSAAMASGERTCSCSLTIRPRSEMESSYAVATRRSWQWWLDRKWQEIWIFFWSDFGFKGCSLKLLISLCQIS